MELGDQDMPPDLLQMNAESSGDGGDDVEMENESSGGACLYSFPRRNI
jgi:hypothetical protein